MFSFVLLSAMIDSVHQKLTKTRRHHNIRYAGWWWSRDGFLLGIDEGRLNTQQIELEPSPSARCYWQMIIWGRVFLFLSQPPVRSQESRNRWIAFKTQFTKATRRGKSLLWQISPFPKSESEELVGPKRLRVEKITLLYFWSKRNTPGKIPQLACQTFFGTLRFRNSGGRFT